MCVCVCVRQMRVVCGRTVLNTLRNPQTSYAQMALNIFFAILVGLIYYQMPLTLTEGLQNRYRSVHPTCGAALLSTVNASSFLKAIL